MMLIMGVDPGSEETAFIVVESEPFSVVNKGIFPNREFLDICEYADEIAIEDVQCYGMAVGQSVFNTCKQIGRIEDRARRHRLFFYKRPTIKAHFCNSARAKDANVNQVLRDRFGEAKKGQPLEGVKTHIWSALAVAIYHYDNK